MNNLTGKKIGQANALSTSIKNTLLMNTLMVMFTLLFIAMSPTNSFAQPLHQPISEGTIVSAYQESAAIIKKGNHFGLVNKQGIEICAPIYDAINLYNNGYAAVNKNGKWSYVNKQGKKLTPCYYNWVGHFENGVAAVMQDGKWGLLNEMGYEVVPTKYSSPQAAFQHNPAVKYNVLDKTSTGATVVNIFQEETAVIKKDGKVGFINSLGYEIVAPKYDNVIGFYHGFAGVKKDGKWAFVNKQGKIIGNKSYDWIGYFENGLAMVMNGKKMGFLNEQGAEVVPPKFDGLYVDEAEVIWVKANNTWKGYKNGAAIDSGVAAND